MVTKTKNVGASALDKLKNKAKKDKTPVMSLVDQYVYTGFLRRLSKTEWKDFFALKGGLMMLVLTGKSIRPTRDIDLDGKDTMTLTELKAAVCQIMEVELPEDDGVVFLPETLDVLKDRTDGMISGAKVRVDAKVGSAKVKVNVDVGFKNIVTPGLSPATMPAQIKGEAPVDLLMYPVETSIAEKFRAMMFFGKTNSRLKDFWDIQTFSQLQELDGETLAAAIRSSCDAFGFSVENAEDIEAFHDANVPIFEPQWNAFLKKNKVPGDSFQQCTGELKDFLVPVVDFINEEGSSPGIWIPEEGWSEFAHKPLSGI